MSLIVGGPPPAYVGRFAPSPSGPLHAGSLVAAMASFLDARAHAGRWLLRIEDVDLPRTVPGADAVIQRQLHNLHMHWDGPVMRQSQRDARYEAVMAKLAERGLIYGCGCTRREIAEAAARRSATPKVNGSGTVAGSGNGNVNGNATSNGKVNVNAPAAPNTTDSTERPYTGTCSHGLAPGRAARAWRVRVPPGVDRYNDRWLGPQSQDVAHEVGDFVIKRADGLWAYQFAVVVDDADQGVTDIVRGADLLTSTSRQRALQRLLDVPNPRMMHVPLIVDAATGFKLSKQNNAPALEVSAPVATLNAAWQALGFASLPARDAADFWVRAVPIWSARFVAKRSAPMV
ncbi:tRNA glutamyl-Q(34) synthetase GluQRS [Schauerella aestuarii]|uniref:tRNA glutamyl-Q(34) synthetase GluQRS n=1 Tax=Schauerella aestuarii TaxID=2511204 RepID=UPI002E29423A|nr:tRNA glutamyl-Q(34) synthetase GluQRS [Achromobacter aestuarii]